MKADRNTIVFVLALIALVLLIVFLAQRVF